MKKTLIAVAALSAMAASAMAANVTAYGTADLGLWFQNTKTSGYTGTDAKKNGTVRKTTMESGLNSASKFGLKGEEDLGSFKVGFNYEGAINADTGSSKLFERLAVLKVTGAFGALQVGRMGAITGGTNGGVMTAGMAGTGTSFKAGGAEALMITETSRINNGIQYKTPSFAGFTAAVQYSLGTTDNGNLHNSDTFGAVTLQYSNSGLNIGVGFDQTKPANRKSLRNTHQPRTILGYVNYDFGVATAYLGYQYNEHKFVAPGSTYTGLGTKLAEVNAKAATNYAPAVPAQERTDYTSNVVTVAAKIPVAGGNLFPQVGYFKAEDKANAAMDDIKGFNVAATYTYALSKRTTLWGSAAYVQAKQDNVKGKYTSAMAGMTHQF